MANPRQKRKQRSSRPTVRPPNKRKRLLNPLGNDLIAKNWNKHETLSQNYRRMGLVAKLGTTAGGIDKRVAAAGATPEGVRDPFSVRRGAPGAVPPGAVREARLERDGEGRVVRVVHLGRERNPLGDLLGVFDKEEGEPRDEWAGIEDRDGDEGRPEVLRLLEKEAGVRTERVVRHQSTREAEWLGRLVGKYGADVEAMAMDMKMNPMQQTAADVRKRLKKAGFLTE